MGRGEKIPITQLEFNIVYDGGLKHFYVGEKFYLKGE